MPDCDREGAFACQNVVEFASDCVKNMQLRETQFRADAACVSGTHQPEISDRMRGILVDWLIGVHKKYLLRLETLYLTIDMIDRYCELKMVSRKHFQLLGITALFVASKYQEIYPPEMRDFTKITDNTYSREDIMHQEEVLLHTLNFDVNMPTVLFFLDRFTRVAKLT